jgi:hypothetical protein
MAPYVHKLAHKYNVYANSFFVASGVGGGGGGEGGEGGQT